MGVVVALFLINILLRMDYSSSACQESTDDRCEGVSPCLNLSSFTQPGECSICYNDNNCRQHEGEFCMALGVCSKGGLEDALVCNSRCSSCYALEDASGNDLQEQIPYYLCGCDANYETCQNNTICQGVLFTVLVTLIDIMENVTDANGVPLHHVGVCVDGTIDDDYYYDDDIYFNDTCLSAYSTVQVRDNVEQIKLGNLQLGDEIATANQGEYAYQKVYAFGHLNLYSMIPFLKIETNENIRLNDPLEISSEHLMFKYEPSMAQGIPVRADSIRVGDFIIGSRDGEIEMVTKVAKTERSGVFSPLVQDGVFLSGGVQVSSYTSYTTAESSLYSTDPQFVKIGEYNIVSHHMLSHVAISPFRIICRGGLKDICNARNSDGQLLFAASAVQWMSFFSAKQVIFAVLLFVSTSPLYFLEQLLQCVDATSDFPNFFSVLLPLAVVFTLLFKSFSKKA